MDFDSIIKIIRWPFIVALSGLFIPLLAVAIFESLGSIGLLLFSAAFIRSCDVDISTPIDLKRLPKTARRFCISLGSGTIPLLGTGVRTCQLNMIAQHRCINLCHGETL
jgi:hypothetical protein